VHIELVPPLAAFALHLARVAATLGLAPLTGERGVPRSAIAALALWTSLTIAMVQPSRPHVPGVWLVAAVAGEVALGLLLGAALRLALLPVEVASDVLAHEAGLALPSALDPSRAAQTTALQALFRWVGLLAFVTLGGPDTMLRLLGRSFACVPAGAAGGLALRSEGLDAVLILFTRAFEAALELALPVAAASFLATVAIAALARAVPRFNLFTDVLPIRTVTVIGALVLFLPLTTQAVGAALRLVAGSSAGVP
jgi:flagellar biosynthetic protein FliR